MERVKLIVLCGIPGSGKSTYATRYVEDNINSIHISSDAIRAELYGNESIQGNPSEVFSLMQKRTVEALNEGKNVVYDATNITRKDRSSIIEICPKFAKIECYIIWAPIEECIRQDASRDRTVGKEVIDRMLKRFQAPFFDEGIDEIKIITPEGFDKDQYGDDCHDEMLIPHDNPHHTLDIDAHCCEAYLYLSDKGVRDEDLLAAANAHDVGKPYTKAFVDGKGNPCETAHYYQHQCVGAWISYGLDSTTPKVAWLISAHMDPFMNTKYYRNLPPYLKNDIDILHKADLNAH
jgi:predicted kinase